MSSPINEIKSKQSYRMSRPLKITILTRNYGSLLISRMSPTSAFEELSRSFHRVVRDSRESAHLGASPRRIGTEFFRDDVLVLLLQKEEMLLLRLIV
ncbi:hypothetical protein CDAR_280101 [Caerostris darwini]|uniref:Uncharacterized protein n=1 Tax=Caerostris darwini TaxID=1538125 RepID=A0AAV4S7Z0_9ARAC|nr:hypothetical protein CDAR_280101 [Caerostris darwini]